MCDHGSVQTYDPRFAEEHTDSSDFESPNELQKIKKNKLFLNKELLRKVKMKDKDLHTMNYMKYDNYGNKVEKNRRQKKIQVPDRYKEINRKSESIDIFNESFQKQNQKTDESKSEIVLRDKVITRFSNIFRHVNSKDKHTAIEENCLKSDHACQVYSFNCKNTTKRFKKVISDLDPVHELKRQTETPYNASKVVNYSAQHILRNVNKKNSTYAVLPVYSSVSSELDVVALDSKEYEENTELHNQYKKNLLRRQHDKQTKISYIYPKQRDYQVFSGLNSQNKGVSTSACKGSNTDVLQAKSSIFWEYMINKIQQKCRHQTVPCLKPCHCGEVGCDAKKTEPVGVNQNPYTDMCCSSSFDTAMPQSDGMCDRIFKTPCRIQNKKIQCQCPSEEIKNNRNQYEVPFEEEAPVQDTRPCQQDHDLVTKTLADKYNGEILCIHNPPCILINGCLNVGPKESAVPMWYVTENKNINFSQNDKPCGEKNSKSHSKYIDIMQYYKEEDRIEREIQSICHHNPPCKFVRQCCKPKNPPKFDWCCVHVPMCRKVPECLLDSEDYDQSCKHKPKCPDLPLCAKDWSIYGEVSNVQSEVKRSSEMICQHHPPCIKIPKCLGRMMCQGFIPYNAIPDCSHQPACARIPACFRKTPKMVSAYSQYPAPCRIV